MSGLSKQQFNQILQKYQAGKASQQEIALLDAYYNALGARADLAEDEATASLYAGIKQTVDARIDAHLQPKVVNMFWYKKWLAAAAVLLFLGIGAYMLLRKTTPVPQTAAKIVPGSNKAILTLAGGQQITLNDAKNGTIATQGNTIISKTATGQLTYQVNNQAADNQLPATGNTKIADNSVSTPRGGQYHVILPDGTVVYLDAASSITYPVAFVGRQRHVAITGQVYFEVVHDKTRPFTVSVKGQTIEDLGTQFNINAYTDEPAIQTTLIEGSIRVKADGAEAAVLRPGQQAVLQAGQALRLRPVDIAETIAWKNGYMQYNKESLESIMRKVARWYNVEVEFTDDALRRETFSGTISRLAVVEQVLHRLELTRAVKFKIQGSKIIILPAKT